MLKERYSGLLSWLVGNSSRVVFDEFHLGLSETPGFVTMARKYRLHYLLVGLMVLAGLFVWRNAVPFIPTRSEQITKEPINSLEMDHVDGLINLLRRQIGAVHCSISAWRNGKRAKDKGIAGCRRKSRKHATG